MSGLFRLFLLLLTIALISFVFYPLASDFGLLRVVVNKNSNLCAHIDAPPGAEDIHVVDSLAYISSDARDWFLSSGTEAERLASSTLPGSVFVWDLNVAGAVPTPLELRGYTHKSFHPHGIHVSRLPDGVRLVLLVNHRSDGHVVSVFTHGNPRDAYLTFIQDVRSPLFREHNDVLALSTTGFWTTNWLYHEQHTLGNTIETFGRMPWNYVVHCSVRLLIPGSSVTCSVVADGLSMPNGITASPDASRVYVADSTRRHFLVYTPSPDGNLTLIKTLSTPSMCDNIDVDPVSGAVFMGCHPNGLKFKLHAEDATHSWAAPSELLYSSEADIVRAPAGSSPFQSLMVDDGTFFSAASVAAHAGGGRVLVGSVFGKTMLDCDFSSVVLTLSSPKPSGSDDTEL